MFGRREVNDMGIWNDFKRGLFWVLGKKITGGANMDQFLLAQGCVIVPFITFLSNPNKVVIKMKPEDFKEFIPVYAKSYSPVYIYKKGSGEYYIFSHLFGAQTSV
jgi:hypothetical protein